MKMRAEQKPVEPRTLYHVFKGLHDEVEAMVPGARLVISIAWMEGENGPFRMDYSNLNNAESRRKFLGLTATKWGKKR